MAILSHNEEWAKNEILTMMGKDIDPKHKITRRDIKRISRALDDLDIILYKSWSKLPLDQLRNVMSAILSE